MTEQYTPTTEEVRDSYRFSNKRPDICGKDFGAEFDRWLAKRDAEVVAKVWDEGREAEELAWEHAYNGHPVPEGEVCDECVVVNPYRKVGDE